MSAIAAVFHTSGREASPNTIEDMLGSLSHRGRDGVGFWSKGPVALGHRAHCTTPESLHVKHPVPARERELVLIADARIDNREDLIGDLCSGGRSSRTVSDEELILLAYERWGEECPEMLLGDFAFALWDGRENRIFCARDHIGVRPFYYYWTDGLFLCASEIKALLRHPSIPNRLNEARVADYLAMNFEDKAITFYRDIFRLPPGSCLTVSSQCLRTRTYWSLDPASRVQLNNDEEYADSFRDLFTKAVRCRLRHQKAPGFLLSGGLDSSSMVCLARRFSDMREGAPLTTFSASFRDFPQVDEQPFIEEVLKGGGIEANYVRADRIGPLHDFERVFRHQDEPFHAPNLFVYWILADAARKQGVDLLIDGVDGDTTVSHGLEYLVELLRSRRLRRLASELGWLSKRFEQPLRRFLWHYTIKPGIIEPLQFGWRTMTGRSGEDFNTIPATVNPEFAHRIRWDDRYRSLLSDRVGPIRTLKEGHWRQLTSGIVPYYLEVNDKAAAAFGLDHRHPFYDRRLVEFCYALPPEQKLSKGWDRVVQRRAMEGILPEKIRWRIRKSHWGPNFKRGLMDFNRTLVESVVFSDSDQIGEYVDRTALRGAYTRCRAGSITESDGMNIWVAVSLALWLRQTGLTA
ncbi:lasso peptide isopeptide bond-forming cyclase [Thermodesulfobacteriota bacterium]